MRRSRRRAATAPTWPAPCPWPWTSSISTCRPGPPPRATRSPSSWASLRSPQLPCLPRLPHWRGRQGSAVRGAASSCVSSGDRTEPALRHISTMRVKKVHTCIRPLIFTTNNRTSHQAAASHFWFSLPFPSLLLHFRESRKPEYRELLLPILSAHTVQQRASGCRNTIFKNPPMPR